MERYEGLRLAAKRKIQIADHMLTMTYPMVGDPKLLLAVLENIFLALTNSMGSLLHYERPFKRVPSFQDTFVSKYNVFKEKCAVRYNIDKEHLQLLNDVKEIIMQHKKSPVEFTRRDSFVICSDDYKMQTISLDKIKKYIIQSKSFIQKIDDIIDKNQKIFNTVVSKV